MVDSRAVQFTLEVIFCAESDLEVEHPTILHLERKLQEKRTSVHSLLICKFMFFGSAFIRGRKKHINFRHINFFNTKTEEKHRNSKKNKGRKQEKTKKTRKHLKQFSLCVFFSPD